jgi:hypothetical protein
MRSTAIAVILTFVATLFAPGHTAQAFVPGFDSAYAGESAFVNAIPGQTYNFQVFFMNTGQTTWRKGTSTQVNLTICLENKISCNVTSPHSDWNAGWLSERAYATHSQDAVGPMEIAAFTYNIKVPPTAAAGLYRFNGDLALPNGQQLHPEGYFQDAQISSGP